MESPQTVFESPTKNDQIDIYKDPELKIRKIQSDNPRTFNYLFEGPNIDNSVVNGLRRVILMYIPIYGFYRTNIHIDNDRSKTMYNNDMLYNQLETLPIFDIPNMFDLENPELFLSDDVMRAIFSRYVQKTYNDIEEMERKNAEPMKYDPNKKQFNVEISLALKNTSDDYLFVTTHHLILRIDGKIMDSYKKRDPISIIVLRRGEEIYLTATAYLGIAKMHAAFEATSIAYHNQISPSKYELKFNTLGQLDTSLIFQKACMIIIKKFEILQEYIREKYRDYDSKEEFTNIELIGEEHTLGNLLATALQKCVHVKEAGYAVKHPFEDIAIIKFKMIEKSKKGSIEVFLDCISYLIKLHYFILNEFTASLGKR